MLYWLGRKRVIEDKEMNLHQEQKTKQSFRRISLGDSVPVFIHIMFAIFQKEGYKLLHVNIITIGLISFFVLVA